MSWDNTPIIDSVQLPGSDTKYLIADAEARTKIDALVSATHFIGVTTTELTDGATTNPITINSEPHTAQTGDIAIYTPLTGSSLEFIWDGSKWQLLGGQSIEDVGDMAYANTASGQVPSMSVVLTTSETGFGVISDITNNLDISFSMVATEGIREGWNEMPLEYQTIFLSDCIHATYGQYYNIETPQSVVTSIITSVKDVAIQTSSGVLPSLTATSSLIASINGTTLTFGLSSLGFNRGSFPKYSFKAVADIIGIEYSNDYLTVTTDGSVCTSIEVDSQQSVVEYIKPIYYSFGLTGNINTTTTSIVATTVPVNVTVSPDPKS